MTADVFEVFDQRTQLPGRRPPGRGARAKSTFAVLFSLALLGGMAFGGWYGMRLLTESEPAVCSAEQTAQQQAYEDWLSDLSADALDKRDAAVTAVGCAPASAAPRAQLVLVDDAALQGVMNTLREAGCAKLPATLPARCTLDTDRGVIALTVARVEDETTDGDYRVDAVEGTRTTGS